MATVTGRVLLVERDGGVATLTLNRPQQRNALSLKLMRQLIGTLDEPGADPAVRVVILAGAGPAFCPGMISAR